MNALCTPDDPIVVGRVVVRRSESMLPTAEMHPIAEFSSYSIAVLAVKLLRRNKDWLKAAELMMDDEDYLTVQVLARRLKKGVASEKVRMDFQLSGESQNGIGSRGVSASLADLI